MPELRYDLRFRDSPDPKLVLVSDPRDNRTYSLSHAQALLAQRMDGGHSIDKLFGIALALSPKTSRTEVAAFVERLAIAGLLANLSPEGESVADPAEEPEEIATHVEDLEVSEEPLESTSNVVEFPRRLDDVVPEFADRTFLDGDDIELIDDGPTASGSQIPVADLDDLVQPVASLELPDEPMAAHPAPPPAPAALSEPAPTPAPAVVAAASPPLEAPPAALEAERSAGAERAPWLKVAWAHPARKPVAVVLTLLLAGAIPWNRYVTEECVVLPLNYVEVRAQVDGILSAIEVDEGAKVTAGDLVARIDESDFNRALQQAEAEVQRLSAQLEKMTSGARPEEIRAAQAAVAARASDVEFARKEYVRRQQLLKGGVGSAEQAEKARRDVELRQAELSKARAELRLLQAGARDTEVEVARAELRKAEAELSYLERKRSGFTITSPIDGVVLTPKFKQRLHERVSPGSEIFRVADTSKVRVEIFVAERERDLIALGQPVVFKVSSMPLHAFQGRVEFIAPAVEAHNGRNVIRTLTVIDNPQRQLHEGMTGYAEINTGRASLGELAFRRLVRWVRVRFLI